MTRKASEPSNPQPVEPESAVDRWRARLPLTSAAAASGKTTRERAVERPRTVTETAEELGLSVHTVRAWIADRRLGHLRLGRAIRVPAAEIRRVIERSTVPAHEEE